MRRAETPRPSELVVREHVPAPARGRVEDTISHIDENGALGKVEASLTAGPRKFEHPIDVFEVSAAIEAVNLVFRLVPDLVIILAEMRKSTHLAIRTKSHDFLPRCN
jgi:hypothetical protein